MGSDVALTATYFGPACLTGSSCCMQHANDPMAQQTFDNL